jgi:hypothetical protein
MKCNLLNEIDYKRLQNEDDSVPFFCISCIDEIFPLPNLPNQETTNTLAPSSPLIKTHIAKLNSFLAQSLPHENEDENDDAETGYIHSPINCQYYEPKEFNEANFDPSKSYSIFHLNIHSITLHIDKLRTLLTELNFDFDIIAITESKLKSNTEPTIDISIENYHPPVNTPTQAEKGGVLLYINKRISDFKVRTDLNNKMYEDKTLESSFIEVKNHKSSNDIVGVIYRHPSMDLDTFNDIHLRPLMDTLSLEKTRMSTSLETLM